MRSILSIKYWNCLLCYVPPVRFQVLQVEDVFNLNKHETFNTFNTFIL
jgi:hypothetical protein